MALAFNGKGGGGGAPCVISDNDPGATGKGTFWLQTSAGGGGSTYTQLWVRSMDNTAWDGATGVLEIRTDHQIVSSPDGGSSFANVNNAYLNLVGPMVFLHGYGTSDLTVRIQGGNLFLDGLPTAAAGLPTGAVYSDSNVLKLAP